MSWNPQAPLAELAKLIAELPDGTDFSQGEVGELFNTLVLESAGRDPARYAEIMSRAAQEAKTPWMKFACQIQEINGKRRVKGADLKLLTSDLNQTLISAADHLDNNQAKYLLLGEAHYNLGIMLRGLRQYSSASQAQLTSSAWFGLAGKEDKQLVGIFVSQVEQLSHSFVTRKPGNIANDFWALVSYRDFIQYALLEYPRWMQDNAALHIGFGLMLGWLMGVFGSKELEQLSADLTAGENSRFPHWAKLFQAFRFYREKKYDQLVNQQPIDLHSSSLDNTGLGLQILVALAKEQSGQPEKCLEMLQQVADHQGADGGMPIAAAKELLVCRQ